MVLHEHHHCRFERWTNMVIVKIILAAYLRGGLFFIAVYYLITADPDGTLQLHWTWLNLYWTTSFLIAYPLLIIIRPQIGHPHFKTKSLRSKSAAIERQQPSNLADTYHDATNPVKSRLAIDAANQQRDADISLIADIFYCGILIIIALPALILVGLSHLIHHRPNKKV